MKKRYVFQLETEFHTYRRLFDSSAPTAKQIINHLVALKKGGGILHIEKGKGDISISDVSIKGDIAVILLRLASETIPDNRFLNKKTRKLRDAPRKKDEAPAVSAHFVMDISSKYDIGRKYPTAIENAAHLSKTIILMTLNQILKDTLSSSKKWTSKSGKQEMKDFFPRLAYHADYKNSINGLIDQNGAIIGIEYADEEVSEVTVGTKASPVLEKRAVKIVPEKKPRGDSARDFITSIFDREEAKSAKRAKIIIEDPQHGKHKVVGFDPRRSDLLKSAFIPQKQIRGIKPPLGICEDNIHMGFVEKIEKVL